MYNKSIIIGLLLLAMAGTVFSSGLMAQSYYDDYDDPYSDDSDFSYSCCAPAFMLLGLAGLALASNGKR